MCVAVCVNSLRERRSQGVGGEGLFDGECLPLEISGKDVYITSSALPSVSTAMSPLLPLSASCGRRSPTEFPGSLVGPPGPAVGKSFVQVASPEVAELPHPRLNLL